MRLKIKKIPIQTGSINIAVMNKKDANKYDIFSLDRISIRKGNKKIIATVDITKADAYVKEGELGLFEETIIALSGKTNDQIEITIEKKPLSINYIAKKLKGEHLSEKELYEIISDINQGKLSDIELTYFVCACYAHELSLNETVGLTKAMVATGKTLKLNKKIIVDKHCIGGVAGNRTTMIVVPIIAAAGLTIPKTSSRSITSAAGTADTVEVLCDVTFNIEKMKKIVQKTNGCFVWGGSVNLAPADDKIIKVEYPMALDPVGQLIASILAKKKSVCATHVLIDIPVGKNAKIEDKKHAIKLKNKFEIIGKRLNMKIKVILTDGSEPIGNGIGPSLEAKDVLLTLKNDKNQCHLLRKKSIMAAGEILELCGKAKKGKGIKIAQELLDSGIAYQKFFEIVKAQGGKEISENQIPCAINYKEITANKSGKITHINNKIINKLARLAGAPQDKGAGIYLYVHKGYTVKKGDKLFRIYSDNKERLEYTYQEFQRKDGIEIR